MSTPLFKRIVSFKRFLNHRGQQGRAVKDAGDVPECDPRLSPVRRKQHAKAALARPEDAMVIAETCPGHGNHGTDERLPRATAGNTKHRRDRGLRDCSSTRMSAKHLVLVRLERHDVHGFQKYSPRSPRLLVAYGGPEDLRVIHRVDEGDSRSGGGRFPSRAVPRRPTLRRTELLNAAPSSLHFGKLGSAVVTVASVTTWRRTEAYFGACLCFRGVWVRFAAEGFYLGL